MVALVKWVSTCIRSSGRGYSRSRCHTGARIVLFIAFLLAFGALIGSAWVLFAYYIPYKKDVLYPGFAIFGQNVAIFLRSVRRLPRLIVGLSFLQYVDAEIRSQGRSWLLTSCTQNNQTSFVHCD